MRARRGIDRRAALAHDADVKRIAGKELRAPVWLQDDPSEPILMRDRGAPARPCCRLAATPQVTGCLKTPVEAEPPYLSSSNRIRVLESEVTISISCPGSMMFTTTEPAPRTSTLVAPTRPE